jgi:hypothetical protein
MAVDADPDAIFVSTDADKAVFRAYDLIFFHLTVL